MDNDALHKLRHTVESRREEMVQLTVDLVSMPTINPPGEGYLEICEFLERRLKKREFEVHKLRAKGALGDSDRYPRWNVIARHEGNHKGECVHFNSHHDVVRVGDGWSVDPFKAQVRDGRIYGRGACDMKGGMAASIIATEAFIDCFPDYSGAIEISGTADEESGGFAGVAWLAEQGWYSSDRIQHAIIPEPLNKGRICLGHRGVWWAEVEAYGRIAHGSMPFLGDCAVRHMGAVVAKMEEKLFPALMARRTSHPVVPDGARQSTMNINSIHGGLPEPDTDYTGLPSAVVPDRCRMVIDRRFIPEETLDQVRGEIVALLEEIRNERDSFRYELREMWSVLPVSTDKAAPVVSAVAEAIEAELGVAPEYVLSPGTYDQKHIDRIGRMHNCIAYGPGILDLAHQPDEYVGIQDMVDATQIMARSLARILTMQKSS